MSATLVIDDSQWKSYSSELESKFEDLGDFLTQFAENRILPKLQSEAGSERNVRTGKYMNDWEAVQEDNVTCVIQTDVYYWKFLEYGTSRGIEAKPIIPEAISEIQEDLNEFLTEALDL